MTFSYLIVRLAEIASLQSSTNRSATLSGFKAPLRRGSDKVSLGESFHRYSAAFASGTAAAPITNGGLANYFYVDLRVGSHTTIPQSVCFDTGSADTWVVGSTCTTDAGHACRRGQKTAVAVDVSFTNTSVHAQTAYGDGTYGVNYTVYYADVTFGGVTATQMPVGVATYLYGGMSGTGILGMGWNSISGISSKLRGSNANFLDTAGFTSFGMYINPSTLVEGEVSFGFYDASMYTGEFQWFPVTYKGWWQFDGHALTFSYGATHSYNYAVQEETTKFKASIVDSGTPELILTTAAATLINSWFNPSYDPTSNTIPCRGHPLQLSFTSPDGNTANYSIAYELLTYEDAGVCKSLIQGRAEALGTTILGAPLYQSVYVAHDKANGRIGFAKLSGRLLGSVPANAPIPSPTVSISPTKIHRGAQCNAFGSWGCTNQCICAYGIAFNFEWSCPPGLSC